MFSCPHRFRIHINLKQLQDQNISVYLADIAIARYNLSLQTPKYDLSPLFQALGCMELIAEISSLVFFFTYLNYLQKLIHMQQAMTQYSDRAYLTTNLPTIGLQFLWQLQNSLLLKMQVIFWEKLGQNLEFYITQPLQYQNRNETGLFLLQDHPYCSKLPLLRLKGAFQ